MAVTSMNRREFLLGATVASVAVPAALSAQHPVQGMARSRFALTVLNPDCMVGSLWANALLAPAKTEERKS